MTEVQMDENVLSVRILDVIKKQLLKDQDKAGKQTSAVDDELLHIVMDLLGVPSDKEFQDIYTGGEHVPDRYDCLSLILDSLSDGMPTDELAGLIRKLWSETGLVKEVGA